MKIVGILSTLIILCASAQAKHSSDHPLTAADWKEVMDKVVLLEDSGLMPTLLPFVMRNRDALPLTEHQVSAFRAWRKKNYIKMVNLMNEIIEKMVQFRIESLSPDVTSEHLVSFQSDIHHLQRQLLKIKLSCRELLMTTFTDEQWESFAFVAADDPNLASLAHQVSKFDTGHAH